MKIAVLGTGTVGQTIAARLSGLGHDVTVGTRPRGHHGPHRAGRHGQPALRGTGRRTTRGVPPSHLRRRGSRGGARRQRHERARRAARPRGGRRGQPGRQDRPRHLEPARLLERLPAHLFVKDTDSLGEQVQRAFPQARVVKTLNTLTAELMVHRRTSGRSPPSSCPATTRRPRPPSRAAGVVRPHRRHRPRGHQHGARTEMLLPVWLRLMAPSARRRSTSRSSADMGPDDRPGDWPDDGRTVLVTGATVGSGWPRPAVWPVSGPGSGSSDVTKLALLPRRGGCATPAQRSTSSSPTSRRSATSVRWRGQVLAAYARLDVLVNNVGGYWATRHETADGLERTFASTTSPRSCSPTSCSTGCGPAPRRASSRSRPARRPWVGSTSTTCRGRRTTTGSVPTTIPSSPTSCSPTSWRAGSRVPGSRPTPCTRGGPDRLRAGGLRPVDAAHAPRRPAVHEEPGAGADTLGPARLVARAGARLRPLLRRWQGQAVVAGLLRHDVAARLWRVSAELVGLDPS